MASVSAQRSIRDPCLVTCPRATLRPGLAVPGRKPGPRAQLPRVPEPGDVADLGHDHGGQHRADAGQLLDDLVAAVAGQQVAGHVGEHGDLGGQLAGELAQRGDFPGIGLRQLQAVQPCLPAGPGQVGMGHRDAELGQHGVDLVLAAGAELDQLVPVAGDLLELADRVRGDPRFRQSAHPQQVRQIGGVFDVVLDPAVAECLHPQRVRQVHLGACSLEHVGGPVPPIRCLQDNPRALPGAGDLRAQCRRAVGDPRQKQSRNAAHR